MPRIQVALGVAPENAAEYDDGLESLMRETAQANPKAVAAVGSVGLAAPATDCQLSAFERQVALADELGLPLIVQAEGAHEQACSLLKSWGANPERVAVRMGGADEFEVDAWLDWGCFAVFDYRICDDYMRYRRIAESLPSDRVLVESGAAAGTPAVLGESAPRLDQVVFAVDALASLVPSTQLAENAKRFFGTKW